MSPLDPDTAARLVAELPHWHHEPSNGGSMTRDYRFGGFVQAFAYMTAVALHAQRVDHHPSWTQDFDRLSVTLRTHVAKGLTMRDIDLARWMDAAFERQAGDGGGAR